MGEKVSRYKVYYYLFVVFLLIVFSVYYAFKQSACMHENFTIAMNEKAFYPPDIVPHFREIEDTEPRRPPDMPRDEWEDYKRAKDEIDNIS